MTDDYKAYRDKLEQVQSGIPRDQILAQLQNTTEYTFDADNPPVQQHMWVDRGLVMSCEGAPHPNHRHFKTRK